MVEKQIVVPLDGSVFGEGALPLALSLARTLEKAVELVSVYDAAPMVAGWHLSDEEIATQVDTYLADVQRRLEGATDVPLTATILSGPVAATLEAHVEEVRPFLVAMSTHGRGPFSQAWLGSVADHVVRHVSIPVVMIRPDGAGAVPLGDDVPLRRILVALDGSERAEHSLTWATRIGRAAGASLQLLWVVPPPVPFASPYLPHAVQDRQRVLDAGREEGQRYLTEVAGRLETEGLDVATHVEVDVLPVAGILHCAEAHGADLLAIGTHGRTALPKVLLGSVADKVVRAAGRPVLVVRG